MNTFIDEYIIRFSDDFLIASRRQTKNRCCNV